MQTCLQDWFMEILLFSYLLRKGCFWVLAPRIKNIRSSDTYLFLNRLGIVSLFPKFQGQCLRQTKEVDDEGYRSTTPWSRSTPGRLRSALKLVDRRKKSETWVLLWFGLSPIKSAGASCWLHKTPDRKMNARRTRDSPTMSEEPERPSYAKSLV